jgi:hypothetical protein
MGSYSCAFKVVKYSYIALLVLGIIGSVLVVFVGIYTWADKSDDYDSYELIKNVYGVNVKDMEKSYDGYDRNGLENYKVKRIERNILGGVLTFIGLLSAAFHVTALIGAIKENVTITTVVLVLSIIGTISTFIKMSAFNFATFVTQVVFIALIAVYLKMIRKQRDSRLQNFVHIYTGDVETGGKAINNNLAPHQPYVFANTPPPGYEEHGYKAKILP